MAIQLPLSFRNALTRLRPVTFADEVSALTRQAFYGLGRLGTAMYGYIDHDRALALDDPRRKALHDDADERYVALYETLLALQALVDKHQKPPRR